MSQKGSKGLKSLRGGNNTKPTYDCPYCKCKRYSPCRCAKSMQVAQVAEVAEVTSQTVTSADDLTQSPQA